MYIRKSSADLQRQDLLQLRPRRKCPHSQGPRQKIICSLGDLRPRPSRVARTGSQLTSAYPAKLTGSPTRRLIPNCKHPRQGALGPPPSPPTSHLLVVHVDQVRTEESREAGPVHVGYQFCWVSVWTAFSLQAVEASWRRPIVVPLAEAGLSENAVQTETQPKLVAHMDGASLARFLSTH